MEVSLSNVSRDFFNQVFAWSLKSSFSIIICNFFFTGSNQSPFFNIQGFYRGQTSLSFSIYKAFTGSNPCLFHGFTGCLQCSGNIYREFTGWNTSGVCHLHGIYKIMALVK